MSDLLPGRQRFPQLDSDSGRASGNLPNYLLRFDMKYTALKKAYSNSLQMTVVAWSSKVFSAVEN